eukprot:scaffold795_cov375-Prasinococcus_capsulatus_cf.AAC.3
MTASNHPSSAQKTLARRRHDREQRGATNTTLRLLGFFKALLVRMLYVLHFLSYVIDPVLSGRGGARRLDLRPGTLSSDENIAVRSPVLGRSHGRRRERDTHRRR